ncbi:hypothetical protein [Dermabacter hominis]|uniref:hypothetical protein n=1 Tax=Dermabacter hominis TaxID=36740 RepID=UPI00223B13CB|nr:hypothetical protein [Dermabacter hominis]MCT2025554.1 hypothetical protein [Dermabacter hominis]
MSNATAFISSRRPRMWFSGLAALALATSLVGCGALADSGQNDQAGSSSTSQGSSEKGQAKGSGGHGVPDRKKQPAGNPDDLKSWLLTEEHLPVDGMKPSEVEVDKEEGDFELSFSLEHPNISPECTDAVTTLDNTSFTSATVATSVFRGRPAPGSVNAESMIKVVALTTPDDMNVMDFYNDVVQKCGNIQGAPPVTVEKPFGGEGVHVKLPDEEFFLAGKSSGKRHIFVVMSDVGDDDARAVIDAQIDLFERSVGNAK